MKRDVMWRSLRWPGLEHLTIRSLSEGIVADGLIVASVDRRAIRVAYRIDCDRLWRTRRVRIELLGEDAELSLVSDGEGHWSDSAGGALPDLAGALDVDISVTPFTNTLPVRRFGLRPGDSQQCRVAYVEVPRLTARVADQRYTCLDTGADSIRYVYESARFRAELLTDAEGLVREYTGLWQRVDQAVSPVAASHADSRRA